MRLQDKETLALLQDTAVKASGAAGKAVLLDTQCEPDHVYVIVDPNGKPEWFEAMPKPRGHFIESLEQLIHYAAHISGTLIQSPVAGLLAGPNDPQAPSKSEAPEVDPPPVPTVVWYDAEGVVIICDDRTRRDTVTLALTQTPQLQTLKKIQENGTKYSQKDFRRLLKIDLADCRPDDVLLNWVSECRFNNQRSAAGVITNQKTSLGNAIESAVESSQGACPEEIVLNVRIFTDTCLRDVHQIRCAVEVLAEENAFRLTPLPLQIHDAIEAEVTSIGRTLNASLSVPCFRGSP